MLDQQRFKPIVMVFLADLNVESPSTRCQLMEPECLGSRESSALALLLSPSTPSQRLRLGGGQPLLSLTML
jgi:hypothetical protein